MENSTIEWALTQANVIVIADDVGNCWYADANQIGEDLPLSAPMIGSGSKLSTLGLLNGAITLGLRCEVSKIKSCAASLSEYVIDLIGSFHNAGRTVGNYRKAAARFQILGRMDLSDYLERHAKEENGHERLAVRDLNALGFPGERLVANFIPSGVVALCELFDKLSSSDYPIGCIGYSYVFESSAAKRKKADIDGLQVLSPNGQDATRFMRAHSSLGSEADHVEDMIAFIAGLPANDRTEIARAAYETAATIRAGMESQQSNADHEMWEKIKLMTEAADEVSA